MIPLRITGTGDLQTSKCEIIRRKVTTKLEVVFQSQFSHEKTTHIIENTFYDNENTAF